MSEAEGVVLAKEGGLAVITLNRPEKLNALSRSMRVEFGRHLREVANDAEIKVVLLRAEGRAFCAGADIVDAPDNPLAWRDRILDAQTQHLELISMRKVVVTAVQGAAVGGGASLALAADILVLAENARLVFPFVRLGLVPDGGAAYFLQAKLGTALALDLLLTGGSLDAADAAKLGLTRRIVPANRLESTGRSLAAELLQLPWEALMLTKALCRQYWGDRLDGALAHEADAFALASSTEGHRRALAAAKSKLKQAGSR